MVIFSRLISDSYILKAAEELTSVAIVGCAACANHSIAYEKDQPVYKLTTDETTGNIRRMPYSILGHMDHLKKLLEEKGVNVTNEIVSALCLTTDDSKLSEMMGNPSWADQNLKKRCANAEAFVSLCCGGGVFGLRRRMGNDVKIIPGMRQIGTVQFFLVLDEGKEFVLLDKERCDVIQRKLVNDI
jgi:hypothetical protein